MFAIQQNEYTNSLHILQTWYNLFQSETVPRNTVLAMAPFLVENLKEKKGIN